MVENWRYCVLQRTLQMYLLFGYCLSLSPPRVRKRARSYPETPESERCFAWLTFEMFSVWCLGEHKWSSPTSYNCQAEFWDVCCLVFRQTLVIKSYIIQLHGPLLRCSLSDVLANASDQVLYHTIAWPTFEMFSVWCLGEHKWSSPTSYNCMARLLRCSLSDVWVNTSDQVLQHTIAWLTFELFSVWCLGEHKRSSPTSYNCMADFWDVLCLIFG